MRKIILIITLLLGVGVFYTNAQSNPGDPSAPLPKEQDKSDFIIPDPTKPDTFIIDSGPGVIADTMSISIPDTVENKNNTDSIDSKSKATPTAPENKPKAKSNKTLKTKTSSTNHTHKTGK